ncbi:MAG: glycine--tRNA ligase subunit beta [bacterium]
MGKELFIEIGTEEIPARFISNAMEEMGRTFAQLLEKNRIAYHKVTPLATPRRLILVVDQCADKQSELVRKVMGPARSVCFDDNGKPTRAAIGFAKGKGVNVDDLKVEKVPNKGEYCVAYVREQERESFELFQELIPQWIVSLSFPKLMRWGSGELKFVRPIHWILALLGGEIVPFTLDGMNSGNKTYGHRFLHPSEITVRDQASYMESIRKAHVMPDPEERRRTILQQAEELASSLGARLFHDEGLLEQVTNLVEYPTALCGSFDKKYLQLPQQVLTTSMIDHQKYFPLLDKKGAILPRFIIISNMPKNNGEVVVRGNERVLRARLQDAEFFFKEDKKIRLCDRVANLQLVVFHERVGSLYDKVLRLKELAVFIAHKVLPHSNASFVENLQRAAQLCKTDLLTQMVGEFPNLQGIMGRIYALADGEPSIVAQAIEEHYLPRFSGDTLPQSLEGSILSVAEKMDNMVSCFALGLIPTGSEDPHALRRQTLGIILITLAQGMPLLWEELISYSIDLLPSRLKGDKDVLEEKIKSFLEQRLENFFLAKEYAYDLIDAVIMTRSYNPILMQKQLDALVTLRQRPEFTDILIPFKRVINILPSKQNELSAPDPTLFREAAETALHEKFQNSLGSLEEKIERGDYLKALEEMTTLKEPIDTFFDKVLVMDQDEGVRNNRLSLLWSIGKIFLKIADFSKIVT